jgi:TonB family protein
MGSVLIHTCLLASLFFLKEPKIDPGPISIEILNENSGEKKSRLIVTETESEPSEDELMERLKAQSQLLSKYSKRVKEEKLVRGDAKRSGARGNAPVTQRPSSKSLKDLDLKPRAQKLFASGLSAPKTKPREELLNSELGSTNSLNRTYAIGGKAGMDQIPGVEEGSFTALNTDQFKYYSFFSRISEAISYRWVSRVRNFASKAPASTIFQLSQVPSPSLLEILLDKDGMVVQVNILKSSGSSQLDDAAVQAFYQASPLNHPPDGMVDPYTRMVHLKFSFLVRWNPVYTARGR